VLSARSARTVPSAMRWLAAAVVLSVGLWLAVMLAAGFYYTSEPGADRLREMASGLLSSVVVGVTATAVARRLTGRPLLSAWALLGVLPAAILAAGHAGAPAPPL
jgi:hypothetical protein